MSAIDLYSGHRQRLRERFLKGGEDAVAEYELLELLLFISKPRQDVKPLAKALLSEFGTFANIIRAEVARLKKIPGLGEASVSALKVVQVAAQKLLREQAMEKPIIASWRHVVDYCKANMQHLKYEELRLLFLDKQNKLIADEVQQKGTIDHAPIYPREIVRRALDLAATGLILVHNHPSGDPTPSKDDITVTKRIKEVATVLGIHLYDHLIIGNGQFVSLRDMGYI